MMVKNIRNECYYHLFEDREVARTTDLLDGRREACYVGIWSAGCNSVRTFSYDYPDVKVATFAHLIHGQEWDLKSRYLREIADVFEPIIGEVEIISPDEDESGQYGRYLINIPMDRKTNKVPLQAFFVFMRHSWEHLTCFEMADVTPPGAEDVLTVFLDKGGLYGAYGHSNFVGDPYTSWTIPKSQRAKLALEVWRNWHRFESSPFKCSSIFNGGTATIGYPMKEAITILYNESLNKVTEKPKVFDPFA